MNLSCNKSNIVDVRNLSFSYFQGKQETVALNDINLELKKGETCAIIGPSGCGKTTLLYVLAGLLRPAMGTVLVDGQPASPRREGTALILQDYGLLPWKKVWDNIALGLRLRGLDKKIEEQRIAKILDQLGLKGLEGRYPAQLSGGQRQRVAIARSLTINPDLLLMDEPFSSLDALTRESLQNLLLSIWQDQGFGLVLVTHSIEEAVFLGQKILVLSACPGKVIAEIPNKWVGDRTYRGKQEFYEHCSSLRRYLERGANSEKTG